MPHTFSISTQAVLSLKLKLPGALSLFSSDSANVIRHLSTSPGEDPAPGDPELLLLPAAPLFIPLEVRQPRLLEKLQQLGAKSAANFPTINQL